MSSKYRTSRSSRSSRYNTSPSESTLVEDSPSYQAENHLSSNWNGTAGTADSVIKIESEEDGSFRSETRVPKKRVPGCCCCYSTKGLIICGLITVVLLAGLGVAIYFLYPRIPASNDVSISSNVQPLNATTPFKIDTSTPSKPRFESTLGVPLSVTSKNYIPWPMSKLDIQLYLNTQAGKALVGSGLLKDFIIKPMTTTKFIVPLKLNYTIGQDQLSSFVLSTILDKCGVTSKARSKLDVDYDATVTLAFGALSDSLPKPRFSGNFKFDCPISQQDISNLASQLTGVSMP